MGLPAGSLTVPEAKLEEAFRQLDRQHNEFTLTISGFMRSGKRQLVLEPKPRIYLEVRDPLSIAVED